MYSKHLVLVVWWMRYSVRRLWTMKEVVVTSTALTSFLWWIVNMALWWVFVRTKYGLVRHRRSHRTGIPYDAQKNFGSFITLPFLLVFLQFFTPDNGRVVFSLVELLHFMYINIWWNCWVNYLKWVVLAAIHIHFGANHRSVWVFDGKKNDSSFDTHSEGATIMKWSSIVLFLLFVLLLLLLWLWWISWFWFTESLLLL